MSQSTHWNTHRSASLRSGGAFQEVIQFSDTLTLQAWKKVKCPMKRPSHWEEKVGVVVDFYPVLIIWHQRCHHHHHHHHHHHSSSSSFCLCLYINGYPLATGSLPFGNWESSAWSFVVTWWYLTGVRLGYFCWLSSFGSQVLCIFRWPFLVALCQPLNFSDFGHSIIFWNFLSNAFVIKN